MKKTKTTNISPPFDLTDKDKIITFSDRDPYNPQNTVEGYVNRDQGQLYGSLWITKVNGKDCKQLIYSAPKQHYPFDRNDVWSFPDCDYLDIFEKLDGTCIIAYTYKDTEGNVFLTYKTRLKPFLSKGKYGNFFELWNEMLKKYPQIEDYCFDEYHNCVFELYGKRNRILVEYDIPLDTQLIFTINASNGQIYPPNESVIDAKVPMVECKGTFIDWKEYTTEGMKENYLKIQQDLEYALIVDEENEIIKGEEGQVWYFMKDGSAVQIKNKPPTILQYHWSNCAIRFESLYTTIVNAFENFDSPTYDDIVGLLSEEFLIESIEKSRNRITKILHDVLIEKKLQYEILPIYNKLGVDINIDKKTVMRQFATLYPKEMSSQIFCLLNRYVNKKSDNMETKKKCKSTMEFGDDHGDNSTTFHCQLEKGHKGKHKEEGDIDGKPYTLEWDMKQTIKKGRIKETK